MIFSSSRPRGAILFDRDGTLIHDVPGLRSAASVEPMPSAVAALGAARDAGVLVGVVTNQPALGEGRLTTSEFAVVRRRIEQLLGPFDGWFVCPHVAEAGCACRKPAAGLVEQAMSSFSISPAATVVIGDIGSDMKAARAASALSVLVPTPVTLAEEIDEELHVENDLFAGVRRALALIERSRPTEHDDLLTAAS